MSTQATPTLPATVTTGWRDRRTRLVSVLLGAALVLSACGSSGAADPVSPTTASPASASPDSAPPTTDSTIGDEPVDAHAPIQIAFDDGRSWTVDGTCENNPDAAGMSATHWAAIGESEDGAKLNAMLVNSLDPDDPQPTLIATFFDEEKTLFAGIDARDSVDGSTLTVELDLHEGFKTADDPPDLVATITCSF